MADVFISYARSDEAVARRVANKLEAAGFDLWWDAVLPAHRAYSDVIERNLAEAKAVVVLWSRDAVASQWVRAEADFARNAGKLVQAQLDGTLPPMPFNQIQCADLSGWRGGDTHAGWAKLRSSIEALVSGEETAAAQSGRRTKSERPRPHWAAAAIALLLIVIGIYFYASGSARVERKPVLAVLPFRSLDGQDESLVAGMWEDTRTAIGRNPQLIVLGPNSAQALAGKSGGAVAKAADYVIEASVRTAGDRIRVSADLVRTRDGEQLWSQDFDRKLDDVFALQSDIASEIEGRIRGRLAEKGGVTPEHIATSGDVYALYSDARAKIRSRAGPDDVTLAHSELEQVVKADPNFAPGWAALAEVIGEIPPSEKRWQLTDSAEVYARKAIDLAPNLAAAHAAMAYALKLNGPIARSELERAVQLDPNDFEALTWLGNMRFGAGDKRGAIISYRRAAEVEPFFWPAVFNLYTSLQDVGDRAGMQQLIEQENAVGADYLATAVKIDDAYHRGDLANAANLGLAYWKTGPKEGRPAIRVSLWTVMLELGFVDEAAKLGPAPDFAPALWKLDPKGLDMMESHHIDVRTFFMLQPLTENASRVYLLSGRSKKLADMYLSLKMSPSAFLDMTNFGGDPDGMHFILSAPLIALALKENGRAADATALLTLAEQRAKARAADGKPEDSALLARIYAAEGRKEEAIALIVGAINRGWLPQPPELLPDLHSDPAFASLKGDPRFERSRQQLLGTIARERAQVNLQLLPQLSTA